MNIYKKPSIISDRLKPLFGVIGCCRGHTRMKAPGAKFYLVPPPSHSAKLPDTRTEM